MKLLDLFCGAGGAGYGYSLAGFDVTGVDHKPQPRYPFRFIQADALEYVREYGREYDVIHASPPCQRYSVQTGMAYRRQHPDLIGPTRAALQQAGKLYVIENVENARRHLINPIKLCGSMFGLNIWRHRYFEAPVVTVLTPPCRHDNIPVLITGTTRQKGYRRLDPPASVRREALQTPWMVIAEMDEAIPPAYTEFIGQHLMAHLSNNRSKYVIESTAGFPSLVRD